jgi:signal peptidase II
MNFLFGTNPTKLPKLFSFVVFFVLIDQFSKFLVSLHWDFTKVNEYLNIVYVKNSGLILGLFSSVDSSIMFFIYFVLFVLAMLIITKFVFLDPAMRNNEMGFYILVFFYSGAIGNTIDRIFRGYVIDFIDIHYENFHWPAFNFADTMISLGIIMYIFKIYKDRNIVYRNS